MQLHDQGFTGSIPQLYERHMVPLIFEPYAGDLAARIAALAPRRVLEIAAGTGVLTRQLSASLPTDSLLVASDLNPAMLDTAQALGTSRPVQWRQADAMALPFPDAAFDLVACQFGVMFFPDKAAAFAEIRRVLAPGGHLAFNVWDHIDSNELAATVTDTLAQAFPADPPRFLARTPHGYHDTHQICADLAAGGFVREPDLITLTLRGRAESPASPALGYCHGTPLRNEIEARAPGRLPEVTVQVANAIAARFGAGAIDTGLQAHVVLAGR
ncbi:MAG: methyltransferase domain-containing protein [Burkholderiales bacterium]|nr:MAG: methyltransferase domain-containing protein [Burkholderiales bacterium]